MSHCVYLGLGSNLEDRLANLKALEEALPPKVRVKRVSHIYETPPWGYLDQPTYLNQVLETETDLAPLDLLQFLKKLEHDLGRTPNYRYGPRLIDVDILFYDNLIMERQSLIIPHPHLAERAFVLVPMLDLAPDYIHPVLGETIETLSFKVDHEGISLFHPRDP